MGEAVVAWVAETLLISTAAATVVVSVGVGIATSFAISAIFKPKEQAFGINEFDSRTLTRIEPAAPWEVVYGQVRKGGKIIFRHSTDTLSTKLIKEDANVPNTAPFTVRLQHAEDWLSSVRVRHIENEDPFNADIFTQVGSNPAAGEYSVAAGIYTFNAANAGLDIEIQYNRTVVSTAHNRLHLVIVLAAHEVEEIGDIYFDDEVVALDGGGNATGRYAGYVYIAKHLGTADQAADAMLISEAPDKWTAEHRGRGHAYIYVRLLRNIDLFPGGVPNITAMVKGRKVFDSRSSTTAWSANAALCQADYLNHPKFGLNAAYGTEVHTALLNAAANICDEDVSLAAGGTEDRYTVNGVVNTAAAPEDVIGRMLSASAGKLVYVGGTWRLRAGAYITPAVTLDEGDLRGPVKVTTRLSRKDACNGVKGTFVSPAKNWQESDFPPVASDTFMTEDGGERIWRDIVLPFTTSAATAQRIAKIELLRTRQQIIASLPLKLTAYRVEPPETELITNARFGWSAKAFEVMESRLVFGPDEIGVDHTVREIASTVYDWSSSEEQAEDPAPDTDLPNPFTVAVPGAPVAVEDLYETRDGRGIATKAIVTWAEAPDGQARRYDLEWKEKTATEWNKHPGLLTARDEVMDLAAGIYMFRVRAFSILEVSSPWSQIEQEIYGLGAAPAAPIITGLQTYGGIGIITMQPHTDLDVRRGGRWRIRHVDENAPTVQWDTAFSIGDPDSWLGDQTVLVVPLKPGSYLVRAEDAVGIQSVAYAQIETKQASVNTFSTLSTLQEDSPFSGTHSGTAATGGVLTLGGIGMFDDIPDLDAVTDIDGYGGIATEGTYVFAAGYNHGSIGKLRLTSRIVGTVVNLNDLIDDRTGNIDDWLDFDGTAEIGGGSSDAWVEYRETDDDPGGSPTWSAWKRIDASEVEARGIQCRAKLKSDDPAYRPELTELRIKIEQLA